MSAIITAIIGFFTKPVASLVGSYTATKQIAAETAAAEKRAASEAKIATLKAKAKAAEQRELNDNDYDIAVLHNRQGSYTDDIIIYLFLMIFIAHFVPVIQPYMAKGWQAMGYNGVPWWFEFVIVGICVSTLGLMRLFRAFWQLRGVSSGKT